MAKPRTPNQKKRYAALNKRLAKYVSLIQYIYDSLALDAANIVTNLTDYSIDTNRPFCFKDYPMTKSRVNELMRYFSHDIQALIYSGTTEEWKQSNLVQDLLANDVLKVYGMRRDGEKVKRYYQPNNDAMKAFQQRKDKGFTISQKVWNQSYNFKRELEYAISSAIEKGQSAITLSKRISKYLHDFPSLQEDYKERYGEATDCKDCEYRSIRLARSEINMSYREAEQARWQQMDFIKGYEIKLSHSHPKEDVCDQLAGVYPKWFKWTGWHPNDLCYVIPIVMTDDEWYSGKGEEIEDLPQNFIDWLGDNNRKIREAEERDTLPYFLKDNPTIYKDKEGFLSKELDRRKNYNIRTTESNIQDASTQAPDKGEFVTISREDVIKKLTELSKDYTHEEAYVIMPDGSTYHKIGVAKEVNFTTEEKRSFKGSELYHNHNYEPFSPHDIAFLNEYKLKTIYAITGEYIYEALPENGYVEYSYDYIANELAKRANNVLQTKLNAMNSANYDRAITQAPFLEIKELCKLLGFKLNVFKNA